MEQYKHIVQYYETDKMGITHHSNYVRWMEEARVDFLERIGHSYKKLEEDGIISPVVGINCKFKQTTTFSDVIAVSVKVLEFKGVKLIIGYEMTNKDNQVVFEATSEHCFIDETGRPIRMKTSFLDFYNCLRELAEANE